MYHTSLVNQCYLLLLLLFKASHVDLSRTHYMFLHEALRREMKNKVTLDFDCLRTENVADGEFACNAFWLMVILYWEQVNKLHGDEMLICVVI